MSDLEQGILSLAQSAINRKLENNDIHVLTKKEAIKLLKDFAGKEYLNKGEAARYLGVSITTFWRWRQDPTNQIPSYTFENITRYKKSDLDKFYESKAIKSYI